MSFFTSNDLKVGYNKKVVVDEVNFSLEKGQILCLLGPNGSGKSTIIKTIINNIKKVDGELTLENKNLDEISSKNRAKNISIVLTEKVAPDIMTGREIIATGRYPHTDYFGKLKDGDLKIIDEAIEMVNAKDLIHCEFKLLSDGEKQRIMLARAICQQADIMVLDEPTSFLDIKYKIDLLTILNKLSKEQNKTIIMSLHEIELVCKVADKVLLIKDNKIFKYGNPEDVVTDENIEYAYDLKKGSFNTQTGALELTRETETPDIFVLGGDGKGTPIYRNLNKMGKDFISGIIFENDIDYNISKSLSYKTIFASSFESIHDDKINEAKDCIDKANIVIDAGACFHGINKRNNELLEYSIDKRKKIYSFRDNKNSKDITFLCSLNELMEKLCHC